MVLILVKTCMKNVFLVKISLEKFWWFAKKQYLCTRFRKNGG